MHILQAYYVEAKARKPAAMMGERKLGNISKFVNDITITVNYMKIEFLLYS